MRLRRSRPERFQPTSPDRYTPPSYRGSILMLIVSLVGITFMWLAYSWALNQWTPPG
jgi:hypothetical protein